MRKEGDVRHDEFQSNRRFSAEILSSLRMQGVRVRKSDNLFLLDRSSENIVQVTMTLCPLYTVGALRESRLVNVPFTIEQSRVEAKWRVGMQVFEAMNTAAVKSGRQVNAVLTFADLGVLTGSETEEPSLLEYHEDLYRKAAERDLRERLGIPYQFVRYSDLVADFPRFISASKAQPIFSQRDRNLGSGVLLREKPALKAEIIGLAGRLREEGVVFDESVYHPESGEISVKTQEFILSLIREIGGNVDLVEGLLRQYGIFDSLTTRGDAVNIFVEREAAALLLQATDLFSHRRSPRIDILC